MRQDIINDYQVLNSRNITEEEYNTIISLLDKYKMDKDNFIKNSKSLVLKETTYPKQIYNGYYPKDNIVVYNEKSNIIRELLHVASSNGTDNSQGIILRPSIIHAKPLGIGLNEGITDLFLEYSNSETTCLFPFEKLCAKVLEYAFGINLYNNYFLNDDVAFDVSLNDKYIDLLMSIEDYTILILRLKQILADKELLPRGVEAIVKIYMDMTIEDLLEVTKDSKKDCKSYIEKLLKEDSSMQDIYKIIGNYEYKESTE